VSEFEERVNLGCADKVILADALDCVCHVGNCRLTVAEADIGMMVFAMRNPRSGIRESHGLVVILELERLLHQSVLVLPACQAFQHVADLHIRHWCHTAFAGFAFLPDQPFRYLAHDLTPIQKSLATEDTEITEKDKTSTSTKRERQFVDVSGTDWLRPSFKSHLIDSLSLSSPSCTP